MPVLSCNPSKAPIRTEETLAIVYINLDTDRARDEAMAAEFRAYGVRAVRLSATRWTDLPKAEQDRLYSEGLNARLHHKPLISGEKGCYASHLRAWQQLLDSPHAAIVILEDDVRLTPAFARVVRAIADQVDSPAEREAVAAWDMVKLVGRSIDGKSDRICRREALCEGYELITYDRIPSRTAGYVLNRRGAQKLLASRVPFGRPVDVDLRHWWENDLRVLGVSPDAIRHNDTTGGTTIVHGEREKALRTRFRKFRLKAAYTFFNLWYRRSLVGRR